MNSEQKITTPSQNELRTDINPPFISVETDDQEIDRNIKMHVTKAFRESQRLFQTYLPDATPTEPTHITFVPSTEELVSLYLGERKGRHHIEIWENYEDLENHEYIRIDLINSFNHELFHQRTAELVPPQLLWGIDLNELEQTEYTKDDDATILGEFHNTHNLDEENTLIMALMEAVAETGEHMLGQKMLEEAEAANDPLRSRTIKILRDFKLRDLIKNSRSEDTREAMHSLAVKNIIKPLIKQFGSENLIEIFKAIDVEACYGITADDPRFQEILRDPLKIPGLQNLSRL